MNSSHQIKLGAIISYVAIAINVISGLVFTPWMISSIGREEYGLYTLAMSVITLFVFDFGLSAAITRFIAKFLAENQQEKANNFMGMAFRLYIIVDIIILISLIVLYFFIPHIYKELTPNELEKFKYIYILASVFSILSFPFIPTNGVLTAYEKFVPIKICDVVHKVLIVVAMSIALIIGGGLYSLVIINVIAGVLIIIIKLYVIYSTTDQRINWGYFNRSDFKSLTGYSLWTTVISLAQRCIFNLAPSFLGYFTGSASIAILGIAITIEGYTFTFANALNGMFLPKVTRIIKEDINDLLSLMIKVGRVQVIIIGALLLGYMMLGRDFIGLWVGPSFNESYWCALLIVLPSIIHLPQDVGIQAIYATNKVRALAIVYLCMAVVNVILALILAKLDGAIGVCIAICISYLIRTIGIDYILYKKIHINIRHFFKQTLVPLIFPSLLTFGLFNVVDLYIGPAVSWPIFLIKGIIFLLIYILSMWFLFTNVCEKQMIVKPIRKILNRILQWR